MKRTIAIALALIILLGQTIYASDSLPYDTYNYDHWKMIVMTPSAYVPKDSISGVDLGAGAFVNPQDLCVAPNGNVFVADTGNNRIVELNSSLNQVLRIYDSFFNTITGQEDHFNLPHGVTMSEAGKLYVADTENKRVVVLDEGELVEIIDNPQSEILDAGFVFTPLKVAVDYADRVYCVAKGMFQGIMVFESEGNFTGFFGTIEVQVTAWQKLWRRLSTKAERSRQVLFIPTEFTGIDVDKKGFIYASNIDTKGTQAVRRMNPKGEDVINKGPALNLGGDLQITGMGRYSGASYIVDVCVRDKGIYSLLDSRRGRVFTYDHEGNLLYIFGGLGSQEGTFRAPVSIEVIGSQIVVLDALRAEIITFSESEYGKLINEAVALRFDGDEAQAVEKWREVLRLDENFELANLGIGKAYLTAGDNANAMKYLELAKSRHYYSIAFKRYRNEILKDNFGYIMTAIALIVAAGFVYARIKGKTKMDDGEGL